MPALCGQGVKEHSVPPPFHLEPSKIRRGEDAEKAQSEEDRRTTLPSALLIVFFLSASLRTKLSPSCF